MTGIQVWRHPHGRAPPARLRASAWLKNYAAGEIVGGLFYENYLGGAGLMAGAVFGRIAGASAARRA